MDLEEYAESIKEINIPAARRRQLHAALQPEEVTSLRGALGQLMWLSEQGVPLLGAPLSLMLGHTTTSTVTTLLDANKLIRRAKWWAKQPLVCHAHSSLAIVGWTDAAWKVRRDGSSQGGYVIAIVNEEALKGAVTPVSVISWKSHKLHRVARSSSSAETQAASTGEEEAMYCRLVLSEVLYGAINLKAWEEAYALIPGALVLDCRGVYDALSKSESSALGMTDRRSGLEALALTRGMRRPGPPCDGVTVRLSLVMASPK